jgi:hypothetical protein
VCEPVFRVSEGASEASEGGFAKTRERAKPTEVGGERKSETMNKALWLPAIGSGGRYPLWGRVRDGFLGRIEFEMSSSCVQ